MPDQSLTDEKLKARVIEQAFKGDFIGARRIVGGIVDRGHLSKAWRAILYIQRDHQDVQGVKETIVSCPDHSLLYGHEYRELPLRFAKAGNVIGAIEIAKTMGPWGRFSLMMILYALVYKGDLAGAREAVSHIDDEAVRSWSLKIVDELQRNGTSPEEPSQH